MSTNVLFWAASALGIAGGVLAPGEIKVFERAAAAEIGTRLSGESKRVAVHAEPNGLAATWGELVSVEINASDFAVSGLPLFTEPTRSKAGKLGVLRLRLKNFTLNGLRCEKLDADLNNCRYDFGLALRSKRMRLSRSGSGPGCAWVTATALEEFVLKKYREIEKVTVELRGRRIIVEGVGTFLFSRSSFFVVASLVAANETEIHLSDAKIWLDGNLASEAASRALLQSLNPVIDENRDLNLHSALRIQTVKVASDHIELAGIAQIPIEAKE